VGASDRTGAGWVLMAIAVGAGWWYWQLLPGDRRKVLGGVGTGGASGGAGATGATGGTGIGGDRDPVAGDKGLQKEFPWPPEVLDEWRRRGFTPGINPSAPLPYDAGAALASLGWG
jgi:hypothetical protein